jgi:hypothetical protein
MAHPERDPDTGVAEDRAAESFIELREVLVCHHHRQTITPGLGEHLLEALRRVVLKLVHEREERASRLRREDLLPGLRSHLQLGKQEPAQQGRNFLA